MAGIDDLFPAEQQDQWLSDLTYTQFVDSIPHSNTDDSKGRFTKLRKRHDYEQIIKLTTKYVLQFVPTYAEYWSCTCLTGVLTRISIHDQEVFAIHSSRDDVYVVYTFNERFSEHLEQRLHQLTSVKPRKWGKGRLGVQLYDWEMAWDVMDLPEVALLIRKCNLSLMRSGKCVWWRDHNYAMAAAIHDWVSPQDAHVQDALTDEDFGVYYEGETQLRVMQVRDRNRKLVRQIKENYKREHKRLCCQVCGFDFEKFYGEIGSDYIEVHHLKPIADYQGTSPTRLEDVEILCANCHRMIHRRNPPYSPDELRMRLLERGTLNLFD